MASGKDSVAAHHALIDPLIEPDPSDETGLNSHFRSTFAPRQNITPPPGSAGLVSSDSADLHHQHTGSTVETNPFRRSRGSSISKGPTVASNGIHTPTNQHGYPSPPNSASPRREHFSNHRSDAFGSMNEGRPRRSSNPVSSSNSNNPFRDGGLGRSGSLRERFPGDISHRPLHVIRDDTRKAHRAHHLRKQNFQGTDTIDRLDNSGFSYHHDGPFDAANLARNLNWKHSPVAAVHDSNEEALRATPRERIIDAVTKHRPLEGVAVVPPGVEDRFGRVLDYEEGADLNREPGADYKRWPGQPYLPDDLKGKGEPSYSLDKAIKSHKKYGDEGTELRSRHRRNQSLSSADTPGDIPVESLGGQAGLGRSNTTGKSVGSAIKRKFGSLRRRRDAS